MAYRARVGIEMSPVLGIEVPNQSVSLGRREQRAVVALGGPGGQEIILKIKDVTQWLRATEVKLPAF
jgi:hypothetical protein